MKMTMTIKDELLKKLFYGDNDPPKGMLEALREASKGFGVFKIHKYPDEKPKKALATLL